MLTPLICELVKPTFHDTDTDIIARILVRTYRRVGRVGEMSVSVSWNAAFTDRVSTGGNAIASVLLSVRLFLCS